VKHAPQLTSGTRLVVDVLANNVPHALSVRQTRRAGSAGRARRTNKDTRTCSRRSGCPRCP